MENILLAITGAVVSDILLLVLMAVFPTFRFRVIISLLRLFGIGYTLNYKARNKHKK